MGWDGMVFLVFLDGEMNVFGSMPYDLMPCDMVSRECYGILPWLDFFPRDWVGLDWVRFLIGAAGGVRFGFLRCWVLGLGRLVLW
jgi:hypothetical protein